jgi:ATP-dependent helicase/nuclease subunit B
LISESPPRHGFARVATIAPGSPFLKTLVDSCIDGSLGVRFPSNGRDYSAATIYVPTRRAARALAHAFAEALQPRAILLPRIIPLGDPSDLEVRSILAPDTLLGSSSVLPAIADLDRRLLLTSLVEGWRNSLGLQALAHAGDGFTLAGGFADSFSLAGDLAGLIDEFAVEGVNWGRVANLTQGQFDTYWSLTRSFLEIAGQAWPVILAERNLLDPSERLNRLLRNEAVRLQTSDLDNPVIAAGSTGTVPATADLLAVIARLPQGVVVLPGLDTTMDARAWNLVADQGHQVDAQPGHPQAAMKHLISRLQVLREDVIVLGHETDQAFTRTGIIQASARAAEATDDWPAMRAKMAQKLASGLAGLSVIEATDEREEALAIAIALRGVLENGNETAALVTPDRALAQRVATELKRWGIEADDSSGTRLAKTPLGTFASLIAACQSDVFSPLSVLSLLSHSCAFLGLEPVAFKQAVSTFEVTALRGNELADGLDGLAAALDNAEDRVLDYRAPPPLKRVTTESIELARGMLSVLITAMRPLAQLAETPQLLSVFAKAHSEALENLAGERAALGSDAASLAAAFDDMCTVTADPHLPFSDYAALFDLLMEERVVAPTQPVQGRIKIWGLLEARLMEASLVVLGGLNESIWPPDVRSDPFLNRSMRSELGLPSPERRIGQSAHDFAQALGAEKVIVSRARTVEGTPMVASRFLRRLDAFIGKESALGLRTSGQWLLQAAQAIDDAPSVDLAPRPAPKPSASLQPTSLSVTEISKLYRDPYAVYARHILNLAPLEPLHQTVDARDRGTVIHDVLARFISETNAAWPADPLAVLLAMGREGFAPFARIESVSAFWWPVFEKVAAWFVPWEENRRTVIHNSAIEVRGSMALALADGTSFKLRSRADRIDTLKDGTLAIVDYKTGSASTAPQVQNNLDPQLTLTAAMARVGGFDAVPKRPVSALSYVLVGSTTRERKITFDKEAASIETVATLHIEGLKNMLSRLRSGEDAFTSRRMPEKVKDGGDYDHLARVKEWLTDSSD